MTGRHVALLRGVNVGRAKRVAMAELRRVFEELGFRDVTTLLNSGNVVFTIVGRQRADPAPRIEESIAERLGVATRIALLSAAELAEAVAANPLLGVAGDPSRLLVTVPNRHGDISRLAPLADRDWSPEALAVGRKVAYLWCADGVLASPLAAAVEKALGSNTTARNWATLLKLAALAAPP